MLASYRGDIVIDRLDKCVFVACATKKIIALLADQFFVDPEYFAIAGALFLFLCPTIFEFVAMYSTFITFAPVGYP